MFGGDLEAEGPSYLDLSRIMLGGANLSEGVRGDPRVRVRELGVIPGVEELPADREVHFVVNGEVLVYSDVPVVETGAKQTIEAGIADQLWRRRRGVVGASTIDRVRDGST